MNDAAQYPGNKGAGQPGRGSAKGGLKYRVWAIAGLRPWVRTGVYLAAWLWRKLLFRTRFIAITGSLGKTSTKELLRAALAGRYRVVATRHNQNDGFGVPRSVLRVRPWHEYAVIEIGVGEPGQMHRLARLVRPHLAVLLGVAITHSRSFSNLAQRADEKVSLLDSLRSGGIALVNTDDQLLWERARAKGCRLMGFGTGPGAHWRASQIQGRWPNPLTFRIDRDDLSVTLQSRLFGSHWVPAILAAVAAAQVCGVSPADSARVVADHPPFPGRLSTMSPAPDIVILRDDYNASLTALKAGLEVLAGASAKRRVLALSDFSDSGLHRPKRLELLAGLIAGRVDVCMLIGQSADYGRRQLREHGFSDDCIWTAKDLAQAVELLRPRLQSGDLVLLKGRTTDHVARIAFALAGTIGCWKSQCGRTVLCDFCPELQARPLLFASEEPTTPSPEPLGPTEAA